MTKLTPEIEKQISDRADELTLKMPIDNDYQVGYVQGFIAGHESGATEWAGRSQEHLISALEAITGKTMPVPNKADMIEIATTALAKYREVGNG